MPSRLRMESAALGKYWRTWVTNRTLRRAPVSQDRDRLAVSGFAFTSLRTLAQIPETEPATNSGTDDGRGGDVNYLTLVVLVVPAIIGLVAAATLGPNRGSLFGAGVMLLAVFVLLLFQVTPPATVSRLGSAYGLMLFEWYRWVPSFLVGAAIGSLIFRIRRREPRV